MKRFLPSVLILLASVSFGLAQGQPNGLVFTGSVQKVGTRCINGERFAEVSVYLQFRNDSSSPVIVYRPTSLFNASVKYGSGDFARGLVVVDSLSYRAWLDNPWGTPTEEDYDPHRRIQRALDTNTPSAAGLLTIEPGGYYEFYDTLWPKSGFKIDFTPSKMPAGLDPNLQKLWIDQPCGAGHVKITPEYSSLRIKYDLNLRKYPGATDFLEKLQQRWKPIGNFLLDSNNDISFETQELLLDTNK
jgi:hypothetical protein